jgi:hypothetical protein
MRSHKRLLGWAGSALGLVLLAAGCSPSRDTLVGDYALIGNPAKDGLRWRLASDGTFTAAEGAKKTQGTWHYSRAGMAGTLTVTTDFVSNQYDVIGLEDDTVQILVEPEKDIAFQKVGRH